MRNQCERAETLAGAIALGEASDVERDEYRGHVATCAACLRALGGEREIERVMATVASAREEETWEPSLPRPWQTQAKSNAKLWRWGSAFASIAVVATIGLHSFTNGTLKDIAPTPLDPVVIAFDGQRITLARGPAHYAAKASAQHAQATAHTEQLPVVQRRVSQVGSVVPITRATEAPAVPASAIAASELAPPAISHQAESLQIAPDQPIHDAAPIGGINPATPANAYVLGADGTSAFEMAIDATGTPTKCAITKSSGYQILDDEVCKAALRTKFSPRTIGGKPVSGIYRDAYTFKPPTKN